LAELLPRLRVLLLLDRAHAEHEPRDAIGLVVLQYAVGKPRRFLDIAVGKDGKEGTGQKLGIAWIRSQRRTVIGRRITAFPLVIGMAGGKIGPRYRGPRKRVGRLS